MIASPPFVLLDDARADGAAARLYTDPVQIVTTRRASEIKIALEGLRIATGGGLHAAGFLSYEAGFALEPKLARLSPTTSEMPFLWFGLFRNYRSVPADEVAALLPDPASGWLGTPQPDLSEADYAGKFDQVLELIAAGDLYQANLTFRAQVATAGHPLALYAGLRERSAAGHGAVVATGTHWLLSLSPELFFSVERRTIRARPMKGTAARNADRDLDALAARDLAADPKQRAENLMIVDLLRNDLSRVAVPGSVCVPELFAVETYPTLHQMTSRVEADLTERSDAVDALAALFPCGSITGAPKIRAIEAIAEIEGSARGVYTGAIGRIDAGGQGAAFNVAIRTLVLGEGGGVARLGLGSGIVADSLGPDEWRECLAKGAFVPSSRRFDLFETMRFDPAQGIVHLDRHMARLKASATVLGFRFDHHAARNELQAATFRLRQAAGVRLLLAPSGGLAVNTRALPPTPDGPVTVAVAPLPVNASDFRLRHKTTDRRFYNQARGDAFEVVFEGADGKLTEGSFTNVFVKKGEQLVTPPLGAGLLGGILRDVLIDEGRAVEGDLTAADLADGFFVGNALRGLLPARLARV